MLMSVSKLTRRFLSSSILWAKQKRCNFPQATFTQIYHYVKLFFMRERINWLAYYSIMVIRSRILNHNSKTGEWRVIHGWKAFVLDSSTPLRGLPNCVTAFLLFLFFVFFMYVIQKCFICRPSYSTVLCQWMLGEIWSRIGRRQFYASFSKLYTTYMAPFCGI